MGLVVVVAGEHDSLGAVAAECAAAGAAVAVVSRTLPDDVAATVRFRADPADPAVWERVAMHVEQHLGPVDGVATDADHSATVTAVFGTDLARRGHGAVVTVAEDPEDVGDVLTRLRGTPAATPARPMRDARDR